MEDIPGPLDATERPSDVDAALSSVLTQLHQVCTLKLGIIDRMRNAGKADPKQGRKQLEDWSHELLHERRSWQAAARHGGVHKQDSLNSVSHAEDNTIARAIEVINDRIDAEFTGLKGELDTFQIKVQNTIDKIENEMDKMQRSIDNIKGSIDEIQGFTNKTQGSEAMSVASHGGWAWW